MNRTTSAENTGENGISEVHASKSPAVTQNGLEYAADLQALIAAWPKLPEAIKAGILAMIDHLQDATGGRDTQ